MEKLRLWLILSQMKGLGERTIKKLWEAFGSPEGILQASHDDLRAVVGERRATLIVRREGVNEEEIERTLKLVYEEGLKAVTLEDEDYPPRLREIPDPPPILFYRGDIRRIKLAGIVGSRRATPYTLNWVRSLVRDMVSHGWGVVSGGARGVDSTAHLSAVEEGGYTVCILGFGLLKAEGFLFRKIEEGGGLVMSEFLPDQQGSGFTFPKRNRIIAALSEFVVVPEAGAKSGALITAEYALRYKRRVYVHIGIGNSSSWDGCYDLIEKGARPIKDSSHIINIGDDTDELTEFLKTPRLFEEVVAFMNLSREEVMKKLVDLEIEGRVRRIGSYFVS